jgi:hypothetical protein
VSLATRPNKIAAAANISALTPKTVPNPNSATTEAASTGPTVSLAC